MSNKKDKQNIQLKSVVLNQERIEQEINSIDGEINYIKKAMTQLVEKDRNITQKNFPKTTKKSLQ